MKRLRLISIIIVNSIICSSYANIDTLPTISLEYIQAHPMYAAIKTRSADSVILKTPPVQNQGILTSCVGWALGYSAASIRLFAESGATIFDTAYWCSPSYLFNQYKDTTSASDCSSVSARIQYLGWQLGHDGVCSYRKMPYTTDCTLLPNTEQKIDAMNKRFSANNAPSTNNPEIFKMILDYGWPIVVGMPVYDSFEDMWYDPSAHGIWNSVDTTAHSHGLGHASCIVGYDDTKEAFKVMNSWGTSGGDNGFYWAKYSVVQQGAFKDAVLVSVRDSAQIEGPDTLHISPVSDSAWYHIDNVPENATITWNVTNPTSATTSRFYLASAQNNDSMYVAFRPTANQSWPTKVDDSIQTRIPPIITYQYADLTVTISSGSSAYTVQRRIWRKGSYTPHWPHSPRRVDGGEELPDVRKILLNGQIFILRDEKIYNLQGQEVK